MHPGLADLAPEPAPAAADPAQAARTVTSAARSSFALGLALLPRRRRDAMRALYAFARVVDDVADGPWPAEEKRQVLQAWREEIRRLYRGAPVSLIGRALAEPVSAYDLPEPEFHALIAGMEMDAAGPMVAPEMELLRLYSRRVAGAVGLLSMRIFGAWRGVASERFALALGDALQFTNILRDLAEDAHRGRLYLPSELLAEHGVPPEPEAAIRDPALPLVCRRMATLARIDYATARAAIRAHDRRAVAPALAMMGSYEVTLARLAARGYAPGANVGRVRRIAGGLGRVARPGMRLADV